MTQRRKSHSIGLLLAVVFSAVLLWVLAAVVWLVPVAYADGPEILTITVTSSLETYFYDPGLASMGGTVYFNSVGGEGAGQVLTVTVTYSGTVNSFEGAPAFDDTPPPDTSAPLEITYTVEMSAETQRGIVFTVTDQVGYTDTAVITFTQDNVAPIIVLTGVTDPGYDSGGGELDTDGSNWYNTGDFPGGNWVFTSSTSDDGGAGRASCAAFWNHSNDTYDHITSCSLDGSGSFSGLDDEDDGTVTVAVIVTDKVDNAASDQVVFNIDNTGPTITSPYISEGSDYLYADGLTIYYGDGMGSAAQAFTVNGHSSDGGGVGLNVTDTVDFSPALWDLPHNIGTQEDWSGEYSAASGNTTSGQIIVTVYDLLDNPATQVFTYTRDTDDPTSLAGSPDYDNGNPIVVTYSNATDTGSSGLQWVQLWYKKEDSGTWADSGLPAETGPSSSFNFIPTEGDGTYYFASVATDNVGNQEAAPTGSGDDDTVYDTAEPSVPGNFAYQPDSDSGGDGFPPEAGYYDDTVIDLEWDPSTDDGSGLLTPPYHLGTAPHPTGGLYDEDSPYTVSNSGTYSIYLTAEDNAGNVSDDTVTGPVVVDDQDPQGSIDCPEGTAEKSFTVSWSATDQGPAGLRSTDPYSVSYNIDGGEWWDWITATSAATATFGPDSPVTVEYGHTYCFRMRAVDKAGNVYTTNGDDCTQTIDPTINIKKVFLPIVMAPGPNWGFETGYFAPWEHGGQLAQSVSSAEAHSGSYSALLGSPSYACNGVPVGSAWLRRSVTVPSSGSPTLSFWYRIYTQDLNRALSDEYDLFVVDIDINGSVVEVVRDANIEDPDWEPCRPLRDLGWKQVNFSLDGYQEQTIKITFHNYNRPDNWYNTYTYIDDVSVQ